MLHHKSRTTTFILLTISWLVPASCSAPPVDRKERPSYEITPGEAIGPFAIGMTTIELIEAFGGPDRVSDPPADGPEYWYYNGYGVSAHVIGGEVVGLTSLSPQHAIPGGPAVGMDLGQALALWQETLGRDLAGEFVTPGQYVVDELGFGLEIDQSGEITEINVEPIGNPPRVAESEATEASIVQTGPVTFPKIDRSPPPAESDRGPLGSLPHRESESFNPFQVDLREHDLSALDLRSSIDDLLFAIFDDRTVWPDRDRLPAEFDPDEIMALGVNPGLGVRQLHDAGITGRGVGIAMIDQVLLTTHVEYSDRLRLYEEISVDPWVEAQMHGPAVASIAVGSTVGVAPEADLYYIATWIFDTGAPDDQDRTNYAYYTQAVRRILEINGQLPDHRKIRVISVSAGWGPGRRGYEEMTAAVDAAVQTGLLVVSASIDETHGFVFSGLGRDPLSDPDDSASYTPGLFWADGFWAGAQSVEGIGVPMDSRGTASPTGDTDYVFYSAGGESWSIPYIAGLYALACQVNPAITPEEFWAAAQATGRTRIIRANGLDLPLGPIVDPLALMRAVAK
jgi:hypothetical protein